MLRTILPMMTFWTDSTFFVAGVVACGLRASA